MTIRNPELRVFSELVFKTIRIGFPTAKIHVHLNGDGEFDGLFLKLAETPGFKVERIQQTNHHQWIDRLVNQETEPFWLLDQDVIFYGSVEDWVFAGPMAGALIPEFDDEFTKAITRSRLHTSLLYIDPIQVMRRIEEYKRRHPITIYNPPANLLYPLHLPMRGRTIFYDTAAMLYHAIGGTAFTPAQLDAYFHFHFGTCADVVLPHLKDREMIVAQREAVLNNPALGFGKWREQMEYFRARAPVWDGSDVIAKVDEQQASEARKWNQELCLGNQSAMQFCDYFYAYCHGIDDLVDTLEDGRPTMSKEQMISLFFHACLLYNSDFYLKNRDIIAPIIIEITNSYQLSVKWESSSAPHRRLIGDVLRTCGNRMYSIVALICGGEKHMLRMTELIVERDYLLQHTEDGYPK